MDEYQRALYSGFPRDIGTPERFPIFTAAHFDRVVEKVNQHSNVYCSIAQFLPSGPVCDKVFYDLDAKAPSLDDLTEPEQFDLLRNDPAVAESVLGDVIDDMQRLAQRSLDDDIPIVGLFSGMGVHVHQLFQPAAGQALDQKIRSTGLKYTTELDLSTVDTHVFESMRISKIPNTKRMEDGEETGIWTIPLSAREMVDATVQDLLTWSTGPRRDLSVRPAVLNRSHRPAMEVHSEYLRVTGDRATSHDLADPLDLEEEESESTGDNPAEWSAVDIVEEFIALPCIRERVLTQNPDHKIRWDFAVLMFNYGFSRAELHNVIRDLGWKDYDPEKTMSQLDNIWEHNYADMSCSRLMSEGYCTRRDAPSACETYGWSGGNTHY